MMFLLPLALTAMAGGLSSEKPEDLRRTPAAVRIKVEIISVTLTPRNKAALGHNDNIKYGFKDKYHSLYAYVDSHHLIEKGTEVAEGMVENNHPAVLKPYKFSHPIVAGRHIYLTLRFLNVPIDTSGMTPPIRWMTDIDAVSGDEALVEMITRGFTIDRLIYARLTLLPSGKE